MFKGSPFPYLNCSLLVSLPIQKELHHRMGHRKFGNRGWHLGGGYKANDKREGVAVEYRTEERGIAGSIGSIGRIREKYGKGTRNAGRMYSMNSGLEEGNENINVNMTEKYSYDTQRTLFPRSLMQVNIRRTLRYAITIKHWLRAPKSISINWYLNRIEKGQRCGVILSMMAGMNEPLRNPPVASGSCPDIDPKAAPKPLWDDRREDIEITDAHIAPPRAMTEECLAEAKESPPVQHNHSGAACLTGSGYSSDAIGDGPQLQVHPEAVLTPEDDPMARDDSDHPYGIHWRCLRWKTRSGLNGILSLRQCGDRKSTSPTTPTPLNTKSEDATPISNTQTNA
jgi:hypothetical protein